MSADRNTLRIAFIGFGEVGRRFADDLRGNPALALSTFDILRNDAAKRDVYELAAAERNVTAKENAAAACEGAHLVISAVTAAAAENVAEEAAGFLQRGQIFFDINSAAPSTRQRASAHLLKAGADYVEGAVMAPVKKPGIRVPILGGGPRAEEIAERLNAVGFNIKPVSQEIGHASATKLCRSIIIKGLEALLVDCAKASEHAGVQESVFASLKETFPSIDWHALAEDMKERVATHGKRRSEEMREAGEMLADFGFDAELALAVANAQARGAKRNA
ncbi:MAG: NAD(P)-dependent oxidoreductase [Xanthobacteraceae bacterium]|nr:NAD(P)-dependent oxidoreductase [Xanthobacteraceae bacterium]MCW5674195.1 NAD(P)-dependent oxidoreductase [Xanthobacteraceae bacterium]